VVAPLLFGDQNNAGDSDWRRQTRAYGGAVKKRGRGSGGDPENQQLTKEL
jgi:hypothetical protein